MPEQADQNFVETVPSLVSGATPLPPGLSPARLLGLFDSQLGSRHLDLAARWMQRHGAGFYTIGSSGHEGNAAVAAALEPTDPALLHYRSGAFFLERARRAGHRDAIRAVLLGVAAAAEEPMSGGRHKVFGSRDLAIVPQTSTIASHLPRALGVAFAIDRARRLGVDSPWPTDAVAVCSFGDASANHSTLTGAVNAAVHTSYQGLAMPLLLVCEDNGLGISVSTPPGWIEHVYRARPGLRYFAADGCDVAEATRVADEAAAWVRRHRKPAFLHLRTVRLMAHAGSDVESVYRSPGSITADLQRDPLIATAALLVGSGTLTAQEALDSYEAKRTEVMAIANEVAAKPRLRSASEVMAPLALADPPDVVARVRGSAASPARRAEAFAGTLPEDEGPLTLAQSINRALGDLLAGVPSSLLFGEDIGRKGGVYGVTRGLAKRYGRARVFDTLLDEQSILGLALGCGVSGLLPVAEIQYLAYLHNAADQVRGEAATLRFFSDRQFSNPMVVRIAGYGYQKGFGGHFHNDDAVAALRDIPGLVVASPSHPGDAAAMLRSCVAETRTSGTPCAFLEPIALYHTRDVHVDGDDGWLAPYAAPDRWDETHAPVGRGRTHLDGDDLTIVTCGNGVYMSLRVAARLAARGIGCRVLDLRWLAPLPVEDLVREAAATGRVLVVDETRRSGGVSEGVVTALVDAGFAGPVARVTSEDSFVPLGEAAYHVLLSEETIEDAAVSLAER